MLHWLSAPWLDRSNYPLDWNGPARAFVPFEDTGVPLAERFARTARKHADRIAIDDGARALTYAQALAAVLQLAGWIAAETAPDDLVGILLPGSADFTLTMLACLAAGRLFVPLDSHYPREWLAGVMGDCGMTAVVTRGANDLIPPGVRRLDLDAGGDAKAPLTPLGADAPAFVLFTSGSTGKPKGIVNAQRALSRRVEQYVNAAHVDADDRFAPLSSECTIAGLRERFAALTTGATLHLIDVQRAGARAILNRLRDARITMIYAVPALLRALMQLEAKAPDSLRVVRVGGDAVLWDDADALRTWLPADCRIELGYSSTEAPIMQWFVPDDFPRDGAKIPLGYPLAGNALAIVGEDGEGVAPGEAGELVVRSPYVALGRWSGGAVDARDFPADPNDPACRILRTGDLVRLRADGLIDLIGRKDRQIKIRGVRVEPGELEAALRRQPDVRDAAVFARRIGVQWHLIAYVVGEADLAALKAALRDEIPAALQPYRLHTIDAVPRLASAKLDMAALGALDEDWQRREMEQARVADGAAPLGDTERTVAAIWQRVLGRACGRHEDFFDCGGDSLSTLNLMFGIEEALGAELPVTMIYEAPSIAALAAAIDGHRGAQFSPLVRIKGGDGAPLFIVHGVGGNVMELFAAGRQITGPVYALQARGLDGREAPSRSVTAMARDYRRAIREAFPDGAFHLAGYSSGGLIAYEMAQHDRPLTLTLIDTQTHASQWPLAIRLGQLAKRVRRRVMSRGRRRVVEAAPPMPAALQAVHDATTEAIVRYTPPRFDGALALIVPRTGDPHMADVVRLWRGRCARVRVIEVPGDHRSMVRGENAAHLAAALSSVIG